MYPSRTEGSDQSNVAGLGFFPQAAPSSSGVSVVDDMMHRYMQQCLEYHDQQLKNTEELPHFVKAIKVEEEDEKFAGSEDKMEVVKTEDETGPNNYQQLPEDDLTKIQAARDRAQAIIARFQQQQQQFLAEPTESSTAGSSVFAAVRRIGLAKEQERKDRFIAKNIEYVAAREQQRMQQQALELSAAEEWNREYHAMLEERQQQRYEAQKQRKQYIVAQAGIGTAPQKKRLDRELNKRGAMRSSIAVYVSGFADSSVDENVLRDLFRSYGKIEKVHIYRDKVQGNIKGDGLVIFEDRQDQDEFLNTVCSQVRKVKC